LLTLSQGPSSDAEFGSAFLRMFSHFHSDRSV
jgi:hypothetical protein